MVPALSFRLLIFGGHIGSLTNGSTSTYRFNNRTNELWAIGDSALGAAVAAATSLVTAVGDSPPAISEHTATAVGNTMIVLGGATDLGYLIGVWELSLSGGLVWSHHTPSGEAVQVAGHTAIYHAASGRIIVFGGYSPGRSGLAVRTNTLHA
jgi:hypothetical protein